MSDPTSQLGNTIPNKIKTRHLGHTSDLASLFTVLTPPFAILGLGLVIVGPGDFSFCLFNITEYSVGLPVSCLFTKGLPATGLKDDKSFLFVFVMKAWDFTAGTLIVASCANLAELFAEFGLGVLTSAAVFDVIRE